MRWPIAALFFLVGSFIFFVFFVGTGLLVDTTYDAMDAQSDNVDSRFSSLIDTIQLAFGIICALFFVTGLVLIFVLDSLREDPESYYRR